MRNLAEYRVTKEEVIECLQRIIVEKIDDAIYKGVFGNMEPTLLGLAKEYLETQDNYIFPDVFELWLINKQLDEYGPEKGVGDEE